MADPIKPTQADIDKAEAWREVFDPDLRDDYIETLINDFARHAQQAREQALEEAAKVADERQYATGLEWTPIAIARAIRALNEH